MKTVQPPEMDLSLILALKRIHEQLSNTRWQVISI